MKERMNLRAPAIDERSILKLNVGEIGPNRNILAYNGDKLWAHMNTVMILGVS
jgi:hypothetical protein